MAIVERIEQLKKSYGLSTRSLAIKCGLKQNTLSNQLNGLRELSLSSVLAILKNFEDISADWLLRGKGNMFIGNDKSNERTEKLVDVIATLQESIDIKNEIIDKLQQRIKELEGNK